MSPMKDSSIPELLSSNADKSNYIFPKSQSQNAMEGREEVKRRTDRGKPQQAHRIQTFQIIVIHVRNN